MLLVDLAPVSVSVLVLVLVLARVPHGRPISSAALVAVAVLLASSSPALAQRHPAPRPRSELALFPLIGGNSDVGLGGGALGSLAMLDPARPPFRWRIEAGVFVSFRRPAGALIVPFQDYYLKLSLPRFRGHPRLRLDVRAAFTDESTLGFAGVGNAAPPSPAGLAPGAAHYGRMHPNLIIQARYRLRPAVFVVLGDAVTYNRLTVRPDSLVALARAEGPPVVRSLLAPGFAPHVVDLLEAAVQYDTRDDEIVPHRGWFHTAKLRVSPRVGGALPYGYQRVTLIACGYVTPVPRWLTLSARVVGDALLGAPPFYELARFEETQALGGGSAVRGVPAQRYHGKVKLFANFEARGDLVGFRFRGKAMVLGGALFVDGGRIWTELTRRHPDLDGTGLGLKYGVGGGLRLQQGRTFVVRADVAWSPDARPVSAYFAAGEIF